MVVLLLYAYAIGERSSRRIERRCHEDVACRVICANRTPDHATIARFRGRHERALADTFTQVLALCGRAGLVSVGVVAVDGSLIAGNASAAATRSYAAIREEVERMLGEAAETDAAEDERFGAARGDELPAELVDRRSRLERLRRCREQLEAEQAAAQAAHEANLAWRAEWESEHGRRLAGRKPTPPPANALERRQINVTDPDTRLMRRAGGRSVQGYNAQIVTTGEQVIIATNLCQAANDSSQLKPMIDRATTALRDAGIEEPIGTVLADGGYWNAPQITAIRDRGIDVLVPTKSATRTAPRTLSARQGDEAKRIEAVLDTSAGPRALPPPPTDRRARLRPHQIPARHHPLPPPPTGRLPRGMEPDRRHPQPPQALPPGPRRAERLTASRRTRRRASRPRAPGTPKRQTPPLGGVCATASQQGLSRFASLCLSVGQVRQSVATLFGNIDRDRADATRVPRRCSP
jgi:hypothetical protein